MPDKILKFIDDLASQKLPQNAFNQYADKIKRGNLNRYLEQMIEIEPKILLVGEAPGYKGCRLTGVPFTSEYILLKDIERLGLLGHKMGYKKTNQSARVQKEATATIVWEVIAESPFIPLLWNAYPFHPFRLGNPESNRLPTREELLIGAPFLKRLLEIFHIDMIVAVGNTAKKSLDNLNITCEQVRHPSNGGKSKFKDGLKKLEVVLKG